jgi:glucose 1-dehydrogenase
MRIARLPRNIVVTGAESGIGAACAAAFGAEGDRVAVLYFADATSAQASADAVTKAGGQGIIVQCHVDDEASVCAAFDAVEKAWGPGDVLINSAGLNMTGVTVRNMALTQWQRLIATDLTGAFLTSRRFLNGRGEAPGPASIIHISSIHAYAVRAGGADYCAAKGGLSNLVETLAIEEAPRAIRVNAIEPGMVLTPMNDRAMQDETYRKTLTQNIPMGRAGDASEIADLAVFLASDKARYITGAKIVIDGGLSLMQAIGA